MLPLDDYGIVQQNGTMIDAMRVLQEANKKLPEDRQPHRAVLVADKDGKIVGKLGYLAFLRGLEPRYEKVGDLGKVTRSGWSSDFITTMMDDMRLWKESFAHYVHRAEHTKVKEVMHPATDSIEVSASLAEAVHKIVMYQTLSVLVTEGGNIVGILRLADVYAEIAEKMLIYAASKEDS
jgi:CBS domain-containing protein